MLKINLLPTQKRDTGTTSADGSRLFAIGVAVALVTTGAGLFLFHASKSEELERVRRDNAALDGQLHTMRVRVADRPRVLAELAEIRSREDAIEHLEAARTGPTSMLVELSHLLSPGGRPTVDPIELDRVQHENPTMMFSPTWDPHRLWLRRFSEENRNVVMEGDGRTADDVGEFMRRMMLSQYFDNVRLERSEGARDDATGISVQRFRLAAQVRY